MNHTEHHDSVGCMLWFVSGESLHAPAKTPSNLLNVSTVHFIDKPEMSNKIVQTSYLQRSLGTRVSVMHLLAL